MSTMECYYCKNKFDVRAPLSVDLCLVKYVCANCVREIEEIGPQRNQSESEGNVKTKSEIIMELRAKLGREPTTPEIEARRNELMKQWYGDMIMSAMTVPDDPESK